MQLLEKLWKISENIEILNLEISYNKVFQRTSIGNRNEKKQTLMNKPVYLGFSILELSKILMYEF